LVSGCSEGWKLGRGMWLVWSSEVEPLRGVVWGSSGGFAGIDMRLESARDSFSRPKKLISWRQQWTLAAHVFAASAQSGCPTSAAPLPAQSKPSPGLQRPASRTVKRRGGAELSDESTAADAFNSQSICNYGTQKHRNVYHSRDGSPQHGATGWLRS
jgi:hypothetical protein